MVVPDTRAPSRAQEQMWFADQLDPGDPAFRMWVAQRLRGPLDPARLEAAVNGVVARHESLRSCFPVVDGRPRVSVRDAVPVVLERREVANEAAARAAVDELLARPFDLATDPLVRATLLVLGPDDHVFCLVLHHIVADGGSVGPLFHELATLYSGQTLDPLPPYQPVDVPADVAYWRERLADVPVLDLPTDRPRPAVRSTRNGAVYGFRLPRELTDALSGLARAERATLFMVLFTGFQVLLGRYAGQSDFCVGTMVAGRDREELERRIGLFTRTLVLRADLSGDPTFREALKRLRRTAIDAYARPEVPFEELTVARDPSRNPFFDTMLVLQPPEDTPFTVPGLATERVPAAPPGAKLDLLVELCPDTDGLHGEVAYNTDLYTAETVAGLVRDYVAVLTAAAADPGAALPALFPPPPRLSGPPAVCPDSVLDLLPTDGATAVQGNGTTLSYAQLHGRANRLAADLVARGAGPGTLVGVRIGRGVELVVALLGVLKSGAAYLPLDPDYPPARLDLMVADARPVVVLTEADIPTGTGADPGIRPAPTDPAYVIYTSGSTGTPKGVVVPHGALAARVAWMRTHYELSTVDRVLQFASVSFDTHAEEVYPCLAAGATLVLAPPGGLEDFLGTDEGATLTVLDLPTPYWHELMAAGDAVRWPEALRLLILGADQVAGPALQQWRNRVGVRVLNTYGPTEATIIATAADLTDADPARRPPIGTPLPGVRALVLDPGGVPVPAGAAGELYLGGVGLALGYLRRDELTAQRFPSLHSGRWYRTGDRVRQRPDGQLEFLGRLDAQVKVRGYRVEPGEVEAVLATHPAVRQAAVLARPDGTGAAQLCAYLVGEPTDVRPFLAERLPGYLVPTRYAWLDALPLTRNGKLDVPALPTPTAAPVADTGPGSLTQELVAGIWSEVLGVPVPPDEDVFDLGGHSLLATRVRARLCQATGVEVPLHALFTHRTVRELAAALDGLLRDGTPTPPPITARGKRTAPLTYEQERLWFLHQLDPTDASNNIPIGLRLRGPLDGDALESALNRLVARHESLRTRFPVVGGRPVQEVGAALTIPLERVESTFDGARELAGRRCNAPFDLEAGPLLRAALVHVGPDDHVLVIALHHIVADGWSVGVLFRELASLYSGQSLPALPFQYSDFAHWQREHLDGPVRDELLAHWSARLAGVPPLELPTDRPRPAVRTTHGDLVSHRLPAALSEAVRARSRTERCTLFMTLLTAYAVVLGRHSGQDDFCIGAPVAGRDRVELEPLVGYLANTVTLRPDLSGDPTLRDLLHATRAGALDAYAHQHIPFELVLNALKLPRDPGRTPLFQTLFVLQNAAPQGFVLDGVAVEPLSYDFRQAKVDLSLEVWDSPDGFGLLFAYNTDLFDRDRIERLAGHVERVLAVLAEAPEARLSTVDLLGPDELTLVTGTFNDTAAPYPDDVTLHGLVEAQVARTPDAVAVEYAGTRLTYAELDRRAGGVAAALRERGVGSGDLVAVAMPRCLDLPVALLGILKAGAAYVPLDPEYPRARLELMREDSGAVAVLTAVDAAPSIVDSQGTPDGTAYVIYTSGSTGVPKGVRVGHRAIVNRIHWMQRYYRLGPDDVVLQKTPTSFDVSVWELFWPLATGARLLLAEPGGHRDAGYLRDLIVHSGVTTVHFVPSMLATFLAEPAVSDCVSLRRIVCSGEVLPADLADRCLTTLPGAELHNLYGPTEAAVDVTAWRCSPGDPTVPIGFPVPNTTILILDPHRNPVPVGVAGELYIGGVQLAEGYHARPELTAERFVTDPRFGRLYRTGDRARWRTDGAVEYLGRLDDQVKLRGQRIEPGEIAAALRALPGVTDAAVVLREDRPGDQRLVGYLVGGDAAGAREVLRATLPEHLVPSAVVPVDALPLSPSGKLDRAALPPPEPVRNGGHEKPQTPAEQAIADVWAEVLGVSGIGRTDDFFDLGGHSLLATQVVARLRDRLDARVSVLDVFRHRTVAALARLVDAPRQATRLLQRLTRDDGRPATRSLVCIPYGGGNAVVYQPLADALPDGYALWAVAIPGNDLGLDEARLPFDELARRCTDEILSTVDGPVVLYGHCVGGALTVEIARRLEAAGATVETVYLGATFPFAFPGNRLTRLLRTDGLRSDQRYVNWLISVGLDLGGLPPEQARQVVRGMRADARAAEEHFTRLFNGNGGPRLRAPIVTVVGERDPDTEFHQERYREWHALTDRTGVVVLPEAGHYFLKYRAQELAAILSGTPELSTMEERVDTGPGPGMGRFLAVAAGQLVSLTGSALTEFAVPVWIYLSTGSLSRFALFSVLALVPGLLVAPLAGAVVDRTSRRAVMLAGDAAAGLTQLGLGLLLWTGRLQVWEIYPLLVCLSVALTFQRLAYTSAVPQLVPKRFLGHANGVVQMVGGVSQLLVPLVAVGLLAAIGLRGILAIDVASYTVAVLVTLAVRFPRTMAWRRKEPLLTEIAQGLRYSWGHRPLRAMLLWFAGLNVFLAPMFLLMSPLVLSFGSLRQLGLVAFGSGLGGVLGGLVLTVWGGPRRRRMYAMLLCTLALGACGALAGIRPNLAVVAVAAWGLGFWLTLVNGIYATIVQVKVPQRFHGRVFSLNTLIAWSTIPLGIGLVGPYATRLLAAPARHLAPLVGTGAGRGIGLTYLLFGLTVAGFALWALRAGRLRHFDGTVPDATPDDLVGLEALRRRGFSVPEQASSSRRRASTASR